MRVATIGGEPRRVPEGRGLAEAVHLVGQVGVLALPFLVYVALSVRQVSLDYRLSELVAARQEVSREHERLVLQRAAMLSYPQVDRVAGDLLGMVPEGADEPVLPEAGP